MMAYENQIKCPGCGMSVPNVPEDATREEMLCNQCAEKEEELLSADDVVGMVTGQLVTLEGPAIAEIYNMIMGRTELIYLGDSLFKRKE